MSNFTAKAKTKWSNSSISKVYDLKDPRGKGRLCITMSTLLTVIVSQLTTGLFLTGYLLLYDMDKVSIGIVTFIPYITSLLSIFSPILLERFAKRRWILISMKASYYLINILGITILPKMISDSRSRVIGFVIIVFLSNALNNLAGSGWTAWQANFLPENIQLQFFQVSTCVYSAFGNLVVLFVAFLSDAVTGTEHELGLLTTIRLSALIVGIMECAVWLIPKEFPYLRTERIKFSSIFRIPLKNKKFRYILILLVIHTFGCSVPTATQTAWLLDDIKIGYSTITAWGATYFLFYVFFSKMNTKIISKLYWYKSWALENLMHGLNRTIFAFLPLAPLPMYWILGLIEHHWSAFGDPIKQSLLYVSLPEEDRTCYLSFYQIVINCSTLFGMMLGTFLAGVMGDNTINVFSVPFTSTQVCIWIQAGIHFFMVFACLKASKDLAPAR